MIEVRHLRIVEAIARAGTATEAARRLHLTQPAVSHALAELESRLGARLFHREPRGMAITSEGERLLRTARVVLDEIHQAEYDLRRMREGVAGIMRITTECYTCYHWLPPVLAEFGRRYPEVEVRLETSGTTRATDVLREGVVDLAIVHCTPELDDVVYRPLFEDEVVAIVAPDHPLAGRRTVTAGDFADHILFLHTNPEEASIVTDVLEPAGVRPPRVTPLQLTEAVVAVVQAGLGISAVARWAVEPQLAEGSLVALHIGPDGLRRTWYAAIRSRDRRRQSLSSLVESLQDRTRFTVGDIGAA